MDKILDEDLLKHSDNHIRDNKHVVIIDNSKQRRVYKIKKGQRLQHYKQHIPCDDLLGQEFNTFWLIEQGLNEDGDGERNKKGGKITQITDQRELVKDFLLTQNNGDQSESEESEDDHQKKRQKTNENNEFKVVGDNRNIKDDKSCQKLSTNEIVNMRKKGESGNEIINKLIENSATFGMKTQFSKEKWLRKKEQKYLVTFEVRRPTAFELCELYYINTPEKICHLRPDMLGHMLNLANVCSESRVLLIENTKGLLAGAVIERQPHSIIRLEFGEIKFRNEIIDQMDLCLDNIKKLTSISANMICPSLAKDDPMSKYLLAKYLRSFNSCIIADDQHLPLEIFTAIQPLLQPSASVAVFNPYLQCLSPLLEKLKNNGQIICGRIEELWTREQQVLPLRTHPFMSTDGRSGWVLTGQVLR